MNNDNYKLFEEYLIQEYQKYPNPELAEALIKEYSSHFIKYTKPSTQLDEWIREKTIKLHNNLEHMDLIFGLRGPGQRPGKELSYICTNAFCWDLIFNKNTIPSTYEKVAHIFETSYESVRIGFERKNHDFGERELCRFGLDLCIAIHKNRITENEKGTVMSILNESIESQMMKDLNHHRARYADKFQR